MRVLLIARAGDGFVDIAMRARAWGHDVKLFIATYDRQKRPLGTGLVERVPDWHPWIRWADLVLLESNDYCMRQMDHWRAEGIPIIGGGTESAAWETDRTHGMGVFKRAGIPTPPYREFTDYDSAIAYVKRRDEAFVSKPCWAEDNKALSYVAKSPADLVFMLERWKKRQGRPKGPFILQEKIAGIEMAVAGWYGPAGFAQGWEENWEEKKLMPGGLGPNTGEMGTTMRFVAKSKLADKVLKPLIPQLEKIGYVGNVDVNCIIDEEGTPWPLEFTTRFGWPSTNIEIALGGKDFIEFLSGVTSGKPTRSGHVLDRIAIGVVMAIPDYPYSHVTRKEVIGVPLYGLTAALAEHWHPCEMMMGEAPHSLAGSVTRGPCMVTAGDYVGVMTGTGETVQAARDAVYRRLDRIEMPASPFWRVDIGRRLTSELPKLQALGYATDASYA
jgi:phosphoribosylamine--glycine ligase